jgi:hypothetical protein
VETWEGRRAGMRAVGGGGKDGGAWCSRQRQTRVEQAKKDKDGSKMGPGPKTLPPTGPFTLPPTKYHTKTLNPKP